MAFFSKIFILNLILFLSPAFAQEDVEASYIQIEDAYSFATAPGSVTGASFMVIKNTGEVPDSLTHVQSNIAEINEIHENRIDPDDHKMMMRKIKSITIPAKGSVTLEPKGLHIMLIKLKEPLTLERSFPLTLTFEKAGIKEIDVNIIQPGSLPEKMIQQHPDQKHHHDHQNQDVKEETPIVSPIVDPVVDPETIEDFPVNSFEVAPENIEHF